MRSDAENIAESLRQHVAQLRACRRCPAMHKPVVSCGPILSKVLLVGQAPGDKEPVIGRPFAWTAGKTLFRWFEEACGLTEAQVRAHLYMAAVCRCFPGKKPTGGDRVPSRTEVSNCAHWLERELTILKPELIIPVGRLAIDQFLAVNHLGSVVGRQFRVTHAGWQFDLIPLPHPSGASPWHRIEPGKSLLSRAFHLLRGHPSMLQLRADAVQRRSPPLIAA